MPPDPEGPIHLAAAAAPENNPLWSILLLIVLILVNAFFAASEIAVITLNDNKIRKMAEEGNKKAKSVLRLTKNSSRFLATIQVGVTLSGFLSSAAAAQSFAGRLADALAPLLAGVSHSFLEGASTVVITLALSYFSLVFGELVPKKIAMQRAEQLSFRFVGILNGAATAFHPFIALLTFSTNAVLRLLGFDPKADETVVTEEEILMMVDAGEEKGVINGNAKDMISNIFDFSDATADEVMTHRTDIGAVEDSATVEDVVRLSMKEGYSRIPVYHEDLDNILGLIYVKDLLAFVGRPTDPGVKLTDLMRPAFFVPESKKCSELFAEMTERKTQIAIIVDEYGGTEGLLTMEDLLEFIVGNIQDEFDHEEEEIHKVDENRYTVDGAVSIDEIADLTGQTLPESDFDTIAGLFVEHLGRIPKPNERPTVQIGGLTLTVLSVQDRRITRLLLVTPPPAKELPDGEQET